MFDLEKSISEWRQQMLAARIETTALDELEGHLREDIGTSAAGGIANLKAFELAVTRVGNPRIVAKEFGKSGEITPQKIGLLLWTIPLFFILLLPLHDPFFFGGLLSYTHVLTLTIGYITALFPGAFGIYLIRRRPEAHSATQQQSFARTILLFNALAAGFVVAGLLTGILWVKQLQGYEGYVRMPIPPLIHSSREIGTIIVAAWLAVSVLIQRMGKMRSRSTILMSIIGNIIVCLVWFGPFTTFNGHGITWILPFVVVLLCYHLYFFMIGISPRTRWAEVKT